MRTLTCTKIFWFRDLSMNPLAGGSKSFGSKPSCMGRRRNESRERAFHMQVEGYSCAADYSGIAALSINAL